MQKGNKQTLVHTIHRNIRLESDSTYHMFLLNINPFKESAMMNFCNREGWDD